MSQPPPEDQPAQPQQVPYPPQVPPNHQQQHQYQQLYPLPQVPFAVPPRKRNNCLIFGGMAAVALLFVCGVIWAASGVMDGRVASSFKTLATQLAQLSPVVVTRPPATMPPAADAPTAPPYTEIASKKSALTAAQLDPYVNSLSGASIDNWTGTTLDVATKILSTDVYQIQVDMTGPKDNVFKNPQVYIDITKDESLAIAKGKSITFSGIVDHVDCTLICTVEVKDATYTVK